MTTKRSLVTISPASLRQGELLGVDIFLRPRPGQSTVLLFTRDEAVDLSKLENADPNYEKRILIDRSDQKQYQQYLKRNWEQILVDPQTTEPGRLTIISTVAREVISDSCNEGSTEKIVATAATIASSIVSFINSQSMNLRQLNEFLNHDHCTFTHSSNVSIFSTLLSRELGYCEQEQREIAIGGLLHDIGKLDIDEAILKKAEQITWEEHCLLKRHPSSGFNRLVKSKDLSFGQLMMVYQHHERMDGTGYPCGVLCDDIHPWARLCTVVDVYEALTAERPYRAPMTHAQATDLMNADRGKKFDPNILDLWLELAESREVVPCP